VSADFVFRRPEEPALGTVGLAGLLCECGRQVALYYDRDERPRSWVVLDPDDLPERYGPGMAAAAQAGFEPTITVRVWPRVPGAHRGTLDQRDEEA
jgi:hypothetical protein